MLLLCLSVFSTTCLAADTPTAKPPVTPAPMPKIVEKTNTKDGATMVWIPAGAFLMGSTPEEIADAVNSLPDKFKKYSSDLFKDESPCHKVYLYGFWMYKNDVTVVQYRKFCLATGRAMPDPPSFGWHDDYPMVNVNWKEANAYAIWAGATLPTEAQWEKAARGTNERIFPWGNEWDAAKCSNNVGYNHPSEPSPVGSFPTGVSQYGCLDMAGNVWQWCSDWYGKDYYTNSPLRNPIGADTGSRRVLRGGSWTPHFNLVFLFRSTQRWCDYSVDYRHDDYGFRCVFHAPGP